MYIPPSGFRVWSLSLGLSLGALALTLPLQGGQKSATPPKVYQVDTADSRVYIKVGSATRLGHPHGIQGSLKAGKVLFSGPGELIFDTTSFEADAPATRKRVGLDADFSPKDAKKVTAAMRGRQVLDTENFPTATYRIKAVSPLDGQAAGKPGAYQLEGLFSLHGSEQKVRFTAKLEKTDKKGVFRLSGTFPLKQTDYGIRPYSSLGGLVKVADELQITGDLLLKPAPAK